MQKFLAFLAVVAATVANLWASAPLVLQTLLILMALDIFMGGIVAFVGKKMSSRDAWVMISKKAAILILIMLAGALARMTVYQLPIMESLAGFYIYSEGLSVLENAVLLGIPVPDWLRAALDKLDPGKQLMAAPRVKAKG